MLREVSQKNEMIAKLQAENAQLRQHDSTLAPEPIVGEPVEGESMKVMMPAAEAPDNGESQKYVSLPAIDAHKQMNQ